MPIAKRLTYFKRLLRDGKLERIAGTRKDLWRVVLRNGVVLRGGQAATPWYEKKPSVGDAAGEVAWLDWFAANVADTLNIALGPDEAWKFGIAMGEVLKLTPETKLRVIEGGLRAKSLP